MSKPIFQSKDRCGWPEATKEQKRLSREFKKQKRANEVKRGIK